MELTSFSETDKLIATTLIDSINEDGFLSCALDDIIVTLQSETEVDILEVEAVLHRIQQFDPIGSGARNLSECLTIQIDYLPLFPHRKKAKILISRYLDLLGKRDYSALKRRLNLSIGELQEIILAIQTLNPRPGNIFGKKHSEYIVPDAFAIKHEGKWAVQLNRENMPHLQINHHYFSLIQRNNVV